MAVFTTSDGDFCSLAERIADHRDEPIRTDLDAIGDGSPVVYVQRPDEIDGTVLRALQKRQLETANESTAFGVVTGYTAEQAHDLYFSDSVEDGDEDHLILSRLGWDDRFSDEQATVLEHGEITVDALESYANTDLSSLSVLTNGWGSIHLFVDGGYICGYPESVSPNDYPDAVQPYCVDEQGERDCPLQGDLFTVESLDAAHVFVDSCVSMIDNDETGLPVSVGMGLLNGADTLIGGYKMGPTEHQNVLLNYSLLRAGYSVSERCYLLNRSSHQSKTKLYPYVAFGRPENSVEDPVESDSTAEISTESTGDGLSIDVHDASGYVVDLTIPGHLIEGELRRAWANPGSGAPPLYLLFGEGDHYRLLLYGEGPMSDRSFTLSVGQSLPSQPTEEMLFDSVTAAMANDWMNVSDKKTKEQYDNFTNRVANLVQLKRDARFDLFSGKEYRNDVDDIAGDMERIHEALHPILAGARPLSHLYASKMIEREITVSDRRCWECDRRLFVKEATTVSGTFSRAIGNCPKCGQRFDVPIVDGELRLPYPVVRGESNGLDEDATITIEFQNPTDSRMLTTVFPTVKPLDAEELISERYIQPESVTAELDGRETMTASFEFSSEVVYDTDYVVYGYAIGNLWPYLGIGMLRAGKKRGFKPSSVLR